jgi:hypothetical protein
MKLRALKVMACFVALAGIGVRSAEACDRVAVAAVRSVELSCVSGHAVVPFSAAAVSPFVVAPLAVVPIEIAPAVVVESRVHRAATARAAVVRPLVVRPERVRSVTRVRTIVR